MTLAPRFLVRLWVKLLLARFQRRLHSAGRDAAGQRAAFAAAMTRTGHTEFGREHGLDATTTYAQFRSRVPLRLHAHYKPYVDRMGSGHPDVLAPGRCTLFAETAGTTGTGPAYLPVPDAMLAHFRTALRDALFLYAVRAGHGGVFFGRQVQAGTSTALSESHGVRLATVDGLLAHCLTPWVAANIHSPPAAITRLPEGPPKTAATLAAVRPLDVTLIGGMPADTCALAEAARGPLPADRSNPPFPPALWPNLECLLHTGAPLGLFAEPLRAAIGPSVRLHEVYAAAEGLFAAQDDAAPAALRLLTDVGVFYEFIPLAEYNEARLADTALHCTPLEKVKPGTDQVLVVTTPAGFCRLVTGDIVRFLSVTPPRLEFVGRTGFWLNPFGEQVTERELLETMLAVCTRNGWRMVSFHVAPFQHRIAAGQTIRCHEWWLEMNTHSVRTPTANVLGPALDAELAARNPGYAARRNDRTMQAPQVRLVMPGIFEQWARVHRKTASLSKLPRCRPDRQIADQLAAIARFHPDTNAPFAPAGPA